MKLDGVGDLLYDVLVLTVAFEAWALAIWTRTNKSIGISASLRCDSIDKTCEHGKKEDYYSRDPTPARRGTQKLIVTHITTFHRSAHFFLRLLTLSAYKSHSIL